MSGREEIFISVRNHRAFVSRYVVDSDGSFSWESAANSEELERAALEVVVAQGGYVTRDGIYNCPPELAAQALWHSAHPLLSFHT